MQKEKFTNEKILQKYFITNIQAYLKTKQKQSIAWGEAIKSGLTDSLIIMSWRGKGAGVKAAKQHHQVIMSPRKYCYFDYPQHLKDPLHAVWMTYLSLKHVYAYTPFSKHLNETENKYIIGGEAMLWTEFITSEEKARYQIFPRIAAFSEKLWSGTSKEEYKDFKKRLSNAPNHPFSVISNTLAH